MMLRAGLMMTLVAALPAWAALAAGDCDSLIASVCEPVGTSDKAAQGTRWLKAEQTTPRMHVGDRFPVEDHSLIMDPRRYGLPAVNGHWRYYELEGTVYRVHSDTAEILDVVKDAKAWLIN